MLKTLFHLTLWCFDALKGAVTMNYHSQQQQRKKKVKFAAIHLCHTYCEVKQK